MSCDNPYDGGVTDEDEPELFCTPPPEEILAKLDCWTGEERDAEDKAEPLGPEPPELSDCHHPTSSKESSLGRLNCNRQDLAPMQKGKRSSQARNRQAPNKFIQQLSRSSRMASTRRALTSSTNPSKGAMRPSANHLTAGDSGHSHLATSSSSNPKTDLVVTQLPKQSQSNSSLGQLIGYTSSEEEVEPTPRDKEVKTSAGFSTTIKIRKKHALHGPKSTNLISSNSDSEASIDIARSGCRKKSETTTTASSQCRAILPASRARTSQKFKQNRDSSTIPDKVLLSSSQKSNQFPHPRHRMKTGTGVNNKSTSDGRKKRPASPKASMKDNNKRAKTKGGFLMSDESEAEEYDDGSENDSERAASPPLRQRVAPGGGAADTEMVAPPPLPTKQVNKSRLNMLLGRNKNTQSSPTKNPPSSSMKPGAASSQAATYKQGDARTEQNGKVTAVNSSAHRIDVTLMREGSVKSDVPSGKDLQMRRSLGSISSTSSSQGGVKPLGSDSFSRESSILSKSVFGVEDSGQRNSRPGTHRPTETSQGSKNAMRGDGVHTHTVASEATDLSRNITTAESTGPALSSASQTRRSGQSQVEAGKLLPAVASSNPSQERIRQQTLLGKQTPTPTPESRLAQQHVHKQPGQPPSQRPANQVQSSNKSAASSSLPRGTNPSRPRNATPNPGIAKVQPVVDRASNPVARNSAQMAQKRKVENISGGPGNSTVPIKKPIVAPKLSSMSAQPTSSEGKGNSDTGAISSNSTKTATTSEAKKPPIRGNPTPQAQQKSFSSQDSSQMLSNTTSPSHSGGSRTGQPINKPLITPVSTENRSLNRPKDVHVVRTTSTKAVNIDAASRRGSVRDFFVPTPTLKEPAATKKGSSSRTLAETLQENPAKDRQQLVPGQSSISRSAQSSPAPLFGVQDGKKAPPGPAAADKSISKSIPAAVLHPSFNPTTKTRLVRALGVTSKCLVTSTTVGATHSEKAAQNTPQVVKTVKTVKPVVSIHENAINPPAEETTTTQARPSIVTLKTTATQTDVIISPEKDVASPKSTTEVIVCSSATTHDPSNTPDLSKSLKKSDQTEPHFEYSVFQKLWSGEQSENAVAATEIVARPCTNANAANLLAEQLFENMREQYLKFLRVDFSEQAMKYDKQDCLTIFGAFSPYDYPDQMCYLQIWVERNCVSKYANPDPQALRMTPFIRKEVYILRLFKVIPAPDASDVESGSHAKLPIRVYHKVQCNEIYTTLDAANRAARSLQIELAHVKSPKDDITAKWQEQNLADLNAKVHALDPSMGGEEGCWKSEFNAYGRGGDRLELMVERAGITGPRN